MPCSYPRPLDRAPVADRAVEVELTQKSEARYKQLWADYSQRLNHETRLLYLTGWPAGVDTLLRLAEKQGSNGGGGRGGRRSEMSGRLLTIDEVSAKLGGVKPWTIRSWVSQRRIPYTKVGRLTRFPEDHIEAWIRANTVEPMSQASTRSPSNVDALRC